MIRNQRERIFLATAIAVLGIGMWFVLYSPRSQPATKLRMTAGNATGIRHRLAVAFSKEAKAFGFQIEVVPSDGSESALAMLETGKLDFAFIQGGLLDTSLRRVHQVTPLHLEPLHVLVKPELFEPILQNGLQYLTGHSINRGAPGSGTFVLSTAVLQFAGLDSDDANTAPSFLPDSKNYAELMEVSGIENMPDAVFTVSTLPSPIADSLIDRLGYRLIPIQFGEAFTIQAMSELGSNELRSSIDRKHVFTTVIPAFTYSVERKIPFEPLQTLGTRLLFVANQQVDTEVVQRLLEVLFQSNIAKTDRPSIDASLLELPFEFPMHSGAQAYRQRNKPIIAGDAIDYFEKVLAIAATFAGGTFFVLQWARQSAKRRRESSFASYMGRVIAIERESLQNEVSANLDLASLIRLQKELADLKAEAVAKFANGTLGGEGLIHGFLALVNDARDQLTRLILHQRENIEQLAAQQHTQPDQVWLQQSEGKSANTTTHS